jgi:APA family basic amino acid/polyamine antiporter
MAAATSLFLMLGLPGDTWIRFGVWLLVGLAIYLCYGAKRSRLRRGTAPVN